MPGRLPPAEWARLEAQLAALPAFSKPVKALTRLLASRAADCELDVQGRILLPPSLRAAAGLGREAVVIGVLNRFEIWAPEAWEPSCASRSGSSTTSPWTSSGRPPATPPRSGPPPPARVHRRNPTASALFALTTPRPAS